MYIYIFCFVLFVSFLKSLRLSGISSSYTYACSPIGIPWSELGKLSVFLRTHTNTSPQSMQIKSFVSQNAPKPENALYKNANGLTFLTVLVHSGGSTCRYVQSPAFRCLQCQHPPENCWPHAPEHHLAMADIGHKHQA